MKSFSEYKQDTENEEGTPTYFGVLTVFDPSTMHAQTFVIEEVAIHNLPAVTKELGRSIRAVKNEILQKAKRVNMRDVWKAAQEEKYGPRRRAVHGLAWPLVGVLVVVLSVVCGFAGYSAGRRPAEDTTEKKTGAIIQAGKTPGKSSGKAAGQPSTPSVIYTRKK